MIGINPSKYDRTTQWLHAALAEGVMTQLLLSTVMTVPAGPGLGTRDWHREAFELHAKTGIVVAIICACHWLWVCLPSSRPGHRYLFPWLKHEGRMEIGHAFSALFGRRPSSPDMTRSLIGTIHGLGLLAVTGSAMCGLINYLGYFLGAPIPRAILHDVGWAHIAFGYLIWAFIAGHVSMVVAHSITRRIAAADDLPQ